MTTTIRDLLHQLHQTHDLSVLPVLADALLDAGYPETEAAWVNAFRILPDDMKHSLEWRLFVEKKVHERLTVPCGVCEGRTPQFCSGPCGGLGWTIRPPVQRRQCSNVYKPNGSKCTNGVLYTGMDGMKTIPCDVCKGTGTVEEPI